MPITIAGCGALGSLLASRLIENGIEVQVLQRAGAQFNALKSQGLVIEADGKRTKFPLVALSSDPNKLAKSELIIVLVKTYSTHELSNAHNLLSESGVVLTLQNGLGGAEVLVNIFGGNRTAAGTTTIGAYTISPGITGLGGWGDTVLGPWNNDLDVSWIADIFEKSGIPIHLVGDPRAAIWKKLAINAMVNPVTALTRLKVGGLGGSSMLLELMQKLGQEAVTAAKRAGIIINFDDIWEQNRQNLVRTAANKTSMLQDIEAGRKTEIDAISGSILKFAHNDDDFPTTKTIYSLVKSVDDSRGF